MPIPRAMTPTTTHKQPRPPRIQGPRAQGTGRSDNRPPHAGPSDQRPQSRQEASPTGAGGVGATAPASVPTPETSVPFVPHASYRTHKLALLSPAQVEAHFQALEVAYASNEFRLARIHACRTRAWFARHKTTGEVRVLANACRDRWCPICASAKARRVGDHVHDWLRSVPHRKSITLSVVSNDQSLGSRIDHLLASFKRLRQTPEWKAHVTGGVWFLQITYNAENQTFHPHLHILAHADFFLHATLKKLWIDATGDSSIVWIQSIHSPEQAARYAARYVSRPADLAEIPPDARQEVIGSSAGRHMIGTFGSACKAGVLAKPTFDRADWDRVGSWFSVVGLASTSLAAATILECWRNQQPLLPGITINDIDNEIDYGPQPSKTSGKIPRAEEPVLAGF